MIASKRQKITYDQIYNFLTVANFKSIKKAHNKLGLTQSAVSASINKLETIVGEKLFIRHQNGLDLTTHGFRFFEKAKEAVATFPTTLLPLTASATPALSA